MSSFTQEPSGPGAPGRALPRWSRALDLFHAIGCAAGITFFLL